MSNKISISNDLAMPLAFSPTFTTAHAYVGLPSPTPFGMALEPPVPMYWPPGMHLGLNKLTSKVVHKGLPVVQDGHDCGVMIPHRQVMPSPKNSLSPIHTAFSSRKVNFASSRVLSQGKPTACATAVGGRSSPMTTCMEPISPPLGDASTSHSNTVVVGMSWVDSLIGWGTVSANMITQAVFAWAGRHDKPSCPTALKNALLGGSNWKEVLAKNGIAVLSGVAKLWLTDGPADVKSGVGSPYLQIEAGRGRDAEGKYSNMIGVRILDEAGEYSHDGAFHQKLEDNGLFGVDTRSDGGNSQVEHSINPFHWGAL